MFTKFTLTMTAIIMLISLASCGSTSTAGPSQPSNNAPNTATGTITTTASEENYQMLPVIAGKVAAMKLDASANGTAQSLKKGEVMSITLESNPSTGYSWFASISNTAILAQMGDPEYTAPAQSATPMVGVPGTQTFFFQASDSGSTTLTLSYKRGFETNVAPEQTISITVEVQ